ncbi:MULTISPECIES: glutamine--fructose-6-phosphate transaminase (isomerizing) [Methanobacterium]|uniref:glutamine--fructose-6-phosphate transaminase (isomerizing) n=1 Tax=Methanobacterium TaxID=2160 RepID=UPI00257C8826|nr:glutamine--fructose-6-phosphate transaminase (isomerizing) [Methanobacterium sp.]
MCGIVGCILKNDKAAPVLLDCVQRLEYRGYDSVGLATYSSSGINIKKDRGKINEVSQKLHLDELPGEIGIGHVRWATHGLPTQENAHPHTDCEGKIAVVHNGIIENYKELKDQLVSEGHHFVSQTDTEVIAHLIEKYHKDGLDLEEAINKAITKLHGSYAFAVISTDEPNRILGVRKESPLILGLGDGEYFLASDAPAILQHTRRIIYLADHETFIMDEEGITVKDRDGRVLDKPVETIRWTPEMAQKGGYPHFMLKEIHEQPEAVRNTLFEVSDIKKIVSQFPEFKRVTFVACGTSYHASLVGKYLFEGLLGLPTDVMLASEFEFSEKAIDPHALVIFISQSGETADTLKALRIANKKAKTLAIVNVLGSTATREADYVIFTRAGPEIGVAATKTYISQLTCIYLLAACMCQDEELLEELQKIPDCMKAVLSLEDGIKEMAGKYKDAQDFFFIGRGFSYPTALEGALKLKEITYIHGEGYAAGELKHGPLALIDDDVPVVAVVPPGKSHDRTLSNVQEVKARGARVIGLGSEDDQVLSSEASDMVEFPHQIPELLSPLLYVVPLQLLAYHISVQRGIDPDKPKNLAKCVTVE